MAPNDLQELFNRLKAQPSESDPHSQTPFWTQSSNETYQQPSVSSPIFSPPVHTPNPLHSSNVMSPVNPVSTMGTPGPEQNRTNNLLNLLKFNNQGSQAGPMANLQNVGGLRGSPAGDVGSGNPQSRPVSAQDLMASFQRKTSAQNVLPSPTATGGAEKVEPATMQTGNSKEFLLNLLTKPKEAKPTTFAGQDIENEESVVVSTEVESSVDKLIPGFAAINVKPASQASASREPTPVRHFGTAEPEITPFEAPQSTKSTVFNYVNPFDQLHRSSPLNRSPQTVFQADSTKVEALKHNREWPSNFSDEWNNPAAPALKNRKVASGKASPVLGEEKNQSVSEALKGVGEQVDKQVEEALAQAGTQGENAAASNSITSATRDNVADGEVPIKQEPAADDAGVESSWESAEDEEAEKAQDLAVEVFNFPMKPFVSIHIKEIDNLRPIRQESFMHIAKLSKEFDQIDRCLVTASQTHIMYAQVATKKDNGGFRIIRQDTGDHKQVFRSSGERISNVQMCSSPKAGNDLEAVLGTGVDGSLFWTSLAKSRGELFVDDDVEAQGFIMPPVSTPEEQSSGSQVKTRAKMSSRHSEYFAISRGKHVYLVAPETAKSKAYRNARTRIINSEKYFAEHGLKITTGKACKDFCFSGDDTMIVTLDKSGKFQFWDIRDATTRASDITEEIHEPVELGEPIWTLQAAASGTKPDEKPSVSSIMFLDKERPTFRGIALRYMLIGFKQNHILQLWDLGLGKAVQEIRLPHDKDSDGICSLTYHPRSGIIAIGHPTRNTIYFIHLSAPRYNIAGMDQAKYINLLARGDPAVPRPESTAIMSGLRGFSFAKVGQLRSLDMLSQPVENAAADKDAEEETYFELYVYHSKGVLAMSVKRKDLGWDKDSKTVKPMDAVKEGVIEVKELVPPPKLQAPSEISSNADTTPSKATVKAKKQEAAKASTPSAGKIEIIKKEPVASPAVTANGSTPKAQEPKQVPEISSQDRSLGSPAVAAAPDSYALAVKSQVQEKSVQDLPSTGTKSVVSPTIAQSPQVSSSGEVQGMLSKQFDALYHRIDADKRVQDAAGSAKQDAMLRLVSSTLTENVEKSLNRIVSESMAKEIVPNMSNSVNKTVEKKLSETLPKELNSHLSKEIKAALPQAIQQALKDTLVQNTISTQVAQKVQQQVSQLLQQSMPNLATQAAQKMVSDLDSQTKQQLQQAETRRQQDNAKIQELSNLVHGLSQMVQNMSESQTAFQEQILKMQRPGSSGGSTVQPSLPQSSRDAQSVVSVPDPQKTAEEEEVDKITQLLMGGEYDKATIAWLQSPRQAELFDTVFLRVNPRYLGKVTPLIALSVSAAITASFESHIHQRLEWLGAALETVNLDDPDIKEVAPKIMDVLSQRLQGAYMNIAERGEGDNQGVLRRISGLNRKVVEVRRLAG